MARRALLVGEEKAARGSFLDRALSARGYAAAPFSDAQLALDWARRRQPDLVVLAGPTPGLAAALCRALKLHRSTCLLPVVLVRLPAEPAASLALEVAPDAELDDGACVRELADALERALAVRREQQRAGVLAEVRFRLPSEPERLEELLDLLRPWLAVCGLGAHPAQQMTLAVREVVANAIEWGHRGQRDRLVSVDCWLDGEKVSVLVGDTGPGFDRSNLPHVARPGDPLGHLQERADRNLRAGGFGILMASGLVDHLCYNDAGNEAQLVKFLPSRARLTLPRDQGAARRQP